MATQQATNRQIASLAFSKLTGLPTTLAGYGITDAAAGTGATNALAKWASSGVLGDTGLVETTPGTFEIGGGAVNGFLVLKGIGVPSASTGRFRFPNNTGIRWRNAADTNNIGVLVDASDNFVFEGPSGAVNGTISAAGLLAINGFGTHSFAASGTGTHALVVSNSSSSAAGLTRLNVVAGTTSGFLDAFPQDYATSGPNVASSFRFATNNAGGFNLVAGGGPIGLWTNTGPPALLRWGVNTAGDFTNGTSSHVCDSSGTPTISSGFGTGAAIAGTDYAFVITVGTGSPTSGVVNFGHAFSSAPVAVATCSGAVTIAATTVSSTQLTLDITGTSAGQKINVLVRGY